MSKVEFEKNHFLVIKEAIDPKVANFVYNYFLMKRQVAETFDKCSSPYNLNNEEHGTWKDKMVPNTYSHYADIAMETLLLAVQPRMEKETGLDLIPTYAYARIYKNGDILKRHKDRFSCEISTTMNLAGDDWPIYLEPSGEVGKKGIKVDLKQGDMLVYSGCELEHWREEFKGKDCGQVFLHYNRAKSKTAKENYLDKRHILGAPAWFKGVKLTKIKNHILKIFNRVDFTKSEIDNIIKLLIHDKKNTHRKVNFILLKDIGQPIYDIEVENNLILESFNYYSN